VRGIALVKQLLLLLLLLVLLASWHLAEQLHEAAFLAHVHVTVLAAADQGGYVCQATVAAVLLLLLLVCWLAIGGWHWGCLGQWSCCCWRHCRRCWCRSSSVIAAALAAVTASF
jgi:hypothetical protein